MIYLYLGVLKYGVRYIRLLYSETLSRYDLGVFIHQIQYGIINACTYALAERRAERGYNSHVIELEEIMDWKLERGEGEEAEG